MTARQVHRTLALTILGTGVLQFFLAGLYVFGGDALDLHRGLGSLATLLGLMAVVLAATRRKEALQASAVLFALLVVQHVLAVAGEDVSVLGALHPVNGLAILVLAMLAAAGRPVGVGHGAQARRAT